MCLNKGPFSKVQSAICHKILNCHVHLTPVQMGCPWRKVKVMYQKACHVPESIVSEWIILSNLLSFTDSPSTFNIVTVNLQIKMGCHTWFPGERSRPCQRKQSQNVQLCGMSFSQLSTILSLYTFYLILLLLTYRSKWDVIRDSLEEGQGRVPESVVSERTALYQASLVNSLQHNPNMVKTFKAVIRALFPVAYKVSEGVVR